MPVPPPSAPAILTINSSALLGGAAGAYGGLITNNGTLNYNNSAAQTFSGAIKGTGANQPQLGNPDLFRAPILIPAPPLWLAGRTSPLSPAATSLSPITVNAAATFTENVLTAGGQWNLTNNLTFVDNNPALVLNFSNTLSPTAAALNVNGNINFSSTLSLQAERHCAHSHRHLSAHRLDGHQFGHAADHRQRKRDHQSGRRHRDGGAERQNN
jgi:hypothetical protein